MGGSFSLTQATALIASFEGFRALAYQDSVGVWTIGYGETDPGVIAQYRASGITQPDAFALLERRVQGFYDAVARAVAPIALGANQAAACTSLAYNIGAAAFATSTVCARIKAGDVAGAAAAFLLWDKAGGRVLPGLLSRRKAEAAIFLQPDRPETQPQLPQPQPVTVGTPTEWSNNVQAFPVHIPALDPQGRGHIAIPGAANRVVSVKINGVNVGAALPGGGIQDYVGPLAGLAWSSCQSGADEEVTIQGGPPNGELDLTVWIAEP